MLGALWVGSITIGNKKIINQHTYEQGASMCTWGSFSVYLWSSCGADALPWPCSSSVAVEESDSSWVGSCGEWSWRLDPCPPHFPLPLAQPCPSGIYFLPTLRLHLPCPASLPAPGTYFSVFWDRLVWYQPPNLHLYPVPASLLFRSVFKTGASSVPALPPERTF